MQIFFGLFFVQLVVLLALLVGSEIHQEINNLEVNVTPTTLEQRDIVLGHLDDMIEHYSAPVAIPLARKHIGWYSSGMQSSAEFRAKVNTISDEDILKETIVEFYNNQII